MNDSILDQKLSWLWRGLCIMCGEGIRSNWFDSKIKREFGDDKIMRFWDDKWVG